MKAEDLIKKLKEQPPVDPEQLKRSRRIALLLASSSVISILIFIYGFLQKIEADYQFKLAEQYRVELQLAKEEAERQKVIAELSRAEAEQQRNRAEQALADCEKSKR
jgi:preprotein translocase subunit SecF